ncbi:MAG: hypothetical protein LRZ94_00850 [Candidatus Pacebacteria bacterium]|nr:hypothetical protein [Candidatus Paceibacterota bacterium]
MAVKDIEKKEKEVKDIWLANRAFKKAREIYDELLVPKYFNVRKKTGAGGGKDWAFFMFWIRRWKKEEKGVLIKQEVDMLPDDKVEKMLIQNRKRTVLMLNRILKDYEKHKSRYKNVDIKEVSRLYQIIRNTEEAVKRTEIARGKLKLETVRTLLPYNQLLKMSPEKFEELRKQVNASFDRILQLREGEQDGQASVIIR